MKRATPWLLGAALVIAATAITAATPSDDTVTGPFLVHGSGEEPIVARNLIVELQDASSAQEITVAGSEWSADGNWLVVTLIVSAPHTEVEATIGHASFAIDGKVFQATERTPSSLENTPLRVGTDTVGFLAFELPADLTSGNGELHVTASYATPQLDDVIVIPLTLDTLPREVTVEVTAPELQGAP